MNIVVSQSAYNDDDPNSIIQEVVRFVNRLSDHGAYLREELPINALLSFHADYYLGQVSNGGHGQFVGNSHWDPAVIQDISVALKAISAAPYDEIFRDLRQLIEGDANRGAAIGGSFGFGPKDPAIAELDKRYFSDDAYDVISPANAKWLRRLPELKVVADAEYAQAVEAICQANPERARRLAVRKFKQEMRSRELLARSLTQPLYVACGLLGAKASYLPMLGSMGSKPDLTAPDGRKGTGWDIRSYAGSHIVFLFDDVAMLCDAYSGDGKRQVSFESYVADLKLVAKVPASEVTAAIEAASRMPVVHYAGILCSRYFPGETVRAVYSIGRFRSGPLDWLTNSGPINWLMEMSKSPTQIQVRYAVFRFFGDKLHLFDSDTRPIAILSKAELDRAIAEEQRAHA